MTRKIDKKYLLAAEGPIGLHRPKRLFKQQLRDVSSEIRKRYASKPLYLDRYE